MKSYFKKNLNVKSIDLNINVTTKELRKIIYMVYCFVIFLTPVIPEVVGYGIYSLKNTLFIFLTIISTISLIAIDIKEKNKIKFNFLEILLLIYVFVSLISAIFSKYGFIECILGTNGRGEGVITLLCYAFSFMIGARAFNEDKNILKLTVISLTVASIYGILQANIPNDIKLFFGTTLTNGTAKSTFGNQNFFSSYLCLVLPMMCYYLINTNKKTKWVYLVCVLLGFAGLIYSKTLGGYLTFSGMFILVCAFSLLFTKTKKSIFLKATILTILFVLLFIGLSYTKEDSYISEFKETTREVKKLVTNDKSFGTGRMEIWQKTFMVIKNNKLIGVGPDSLKNELMNKDYITDGDQDVLNRYVIDKAHSEPLQIAATTGIFSLMIYILFILIYILSLSKLVIKLNYNYIRNNVDDNVLEKIYFISMLLISTLGYLIQSLINISVVEVAPIFWIILGLGNGAIIKKDNV